MQYGMLIVLLGLAIFGIANVLARKQFPGDPFTMDGVGKLEFLEVLLGHPTIKWWTRCGLLLFFVGGVSFIAEAAHESARAKNSGLGPTQFGTYSGDTA